MTYFYYQRISTACLNRGINSVTLVVFMTEKVVSINKLKEEKRKPGEISDVLRKEVMIALDPNRPGPFGRSDIKRSKYECTRYDPVENELDHLNRV